MRCFMQANQQANISNGILFIRWSLMRKGTLIAWVLLVAVSVAQTPAFRSVADDADLLAVFRFGERC
jgi:hypothetical protein